MPSEGENYNAPSQASLPLEEPALDTVLYEQFCQWLDEQLVKLERQWAHTAAPAAERSSRKGFWVLQHRS